MQYATRIPLFTIARPPQVYSMWLLQTYSWLGFRLNSLAVGRALRTINLDRIG